MSLLPRYRHLADPEHRPEPRVSDHALVRWLERVERYPLDLVRAAILSPATLTAMRMGEGRVHRFDAHATLVVRNWTVITTLPLDVPGRPE